MFFRKQDGITDDLQKELVQRLGELSGKPSTSKLHIHPVNNAGREHGGEDDEISLISSRQAKKIYSDRFLKYIGVQSQKKQWHSDITFEPIPSDYALLRLTELPKTGGGMYSMREADTMCRWLTDVGIQIPSGPRVTSFMIASPSLCAASWTP